MSFIIGYPIEVSPLAKRDESNPNVAARFELFVCGMEAANGFTELNDPNIQRERFMAQKEMLGEHKVIDEDFLMALEYAMPPAGGLAKEFFV